MTLYYRRPASHSPFNELRDALRSFQDSPIFQLSRNLDGAYSDVSRPALDWHETESAFEIKADVPGIPKEDIKLSFSDDGSVLTLSGEVKRSWSSASAPAPAASDKGKSPESSAVAKTPSDAEQQQADAAPAYSERFFGSFSRSVRFPSLVDAEKTSAALKDGVLSITVPKRQAPGVKHISIS